MSYSILCSPLTPASLTDGMVGEVLTADLGEVGDLLQWMTCTACDQQGGYYWLLRNEAAPWYKSVQQ